VKQALLGDRGSHFVSWEVRIQELSY
jgi:hypothetical protein